MRYCLLFKAFQEATYDPIRGERYEPGLIPTNPATKLELRPYGYAQHCILYVDAYPIGELIGITRDTADEVPPTNVP